MKTNTENCKQGTLFQQKISYSASSSISGYQFSENTLLLNGMSYKTGHLLNTCNLESMLHKSTGCTGIIWFFISRPDLLSFSKMTILTHPTKFCYSKQAAMSPPPLPFYMKKKGKVACLRPALYNHLTNYYYYFRFVFHPPCKEVQGRFEQQQNN